MAILRVSFSNNGNGRRILIAIFQNICYKEYLPLLFGSAIMERYNLSVLSGAETTEYDPDLDATMSIEFMTSSMRFGHSAIQTKVPLGKLGEQLLRDLFFQPFFLYDDSLDDLISGYAKDEAQKVDTHLVQDMTEFCIRTSPYAPYGTDVASLDINRGRLNGLPPYVDFLRLCTCRNVTKFKDLADIMPNKNLKRLKDTYRDVRDVDLHAGGMSEYPLEGGLMGPTFTCILAEGFHRLKFGDRFYFEHGGQVGSFNTDQLEEIRTITLSKVFCAVTNIPHIQEKAMVRHSRQATFIF
ncbi:hypothetical protein LAZ67_13002042 [Cordylochernes scorpioides]|uniref:Peroxidase n=1 Tax=Cordylochernes scorpioides TaxID=51811 RepID=A0ABY6L701_9ARAC|nr:hypothetical protein LAZ67_13002042 [Cordylochernes scorpioides]